MKLSVLRPVVLTLAATGLSACGVSDSGTAAATVAASRAREAEQAQQRVEDIKSQLHNAGALQRDREKALEAAGR